MCYCWFVWQFALCSGKGGLRGFISLLVPFFLPLTLVNNVKYVLKTAFSSPLQPSFAPLFLPFCRGWKVPSEAHFHSPECYFLLIILGKTISFSLAVFRADNTIFHNKDNISIFYKKLKICRINGYWTEYNILMFWFCLKMQ